jgi:hypothetical protein
MKKSVTLPYWVVREREATTHSLPAWRAGAVEEEKRRKR